jgi:signal transduction histidine kinase
VHWRRVRIRSQRDSLTIITLQGQPDQQSSVPTAAHQQARIDRLLVRQALIEESERRRIGRALHDVVVQDLAQTRSIVRASGMNAEDAAKIVASIDRMIDQVRTLTFELGPPILEDLGLRPALQWLAEHLGERYSADITLADDDCDPRLSKQAQTIIFRSVRELAINAAKHAPEAEIVISCITNHKHVRVIVKDNGPGFDTSILYDLMDDIQHYGLLSVEQQIRGVGGAFEIFSEIGAGTRAIITASLDLKKGAKNGSQH